MSIASPDHIPETSLNVQTTKMLEPEIEVEDTSVIRELQDALGNLLVAREDKNDKLSKSNTYVCNVSPENNSSQPPPIVYSWTGAFELFAFPRELRDRIYYHHHDRPEGVRFNRRSARTFPFDQPENITNLFLVSRQVYKEALQVFCRYNAIEIVNKERWGKSLEGKLRLFPDRPGQMLQRVNKTYVDRYFNSSLRDRFYTETIPREVFGQMLREAYTIKSFFPKLREFTAQWYVSPESLSTNESLNFEDKVEEEKIRIWLEWMRQRIKVENVVPPRWLKVKLLASWRLNPMQAHEEAMNVAYARLVRETAAFRDGEKELEESGRRWLEDTWSEGRKKTRRKRRHLKGAV